MTAPNALLKRLKIDHQLLNFINKFIKTWTTYFVNSSGSYWACYFLVKCIFRFLASIIAFSLGGNIESSDNVFFHTASAKETKTILLSVLQLQHEHPEMETKLSALLAKSDDISVTAGGFVNFNKSFLLSFFGILATYIAVLLQTVWVSRWSRKFIQ